VAEEIETIKGTDMGDAEKILAFSGKMPADKQQGRRCNELTSQACPTVAFGELLQEKINSTIGGRDQKQNPEKPETADQEFPIAEEQTQKDSFYNVGGGIKGRRIRRWNRDVFRAGRNDVGSCQRVMKQDEDSVPDKEKNHQLPVLAPDGFRGGAEGVRRGIPEKETGSDEKNRHMEHLVEPGKGYTGVAGHHQHDGDRLDNVDFLHPAAASPGQILHGSVLSSGQSSAIPRI